MEDPAQSAGRPQGQPAELEHPFSVPESHNHGSENGVQAGHSPAAQHSGHAGSGGDESLSGLKGTVPVDAPVPAAHHGVPQDEARRHSSHEASSSRSGSKLVDLWQQAIRSVIMTQGAARLFRTLRDMHVNCEIRREQLQVVRVLGQGAFAVVEECKYVPESGPETRVAVKRLKPEVTQNAADIKAMIKEVALLKKVRNKNIVEFVGWGSWDTSSTTAERQSLFMAEELIDGGNLKHLVARCQRIGKDIYRAQDALRWLSQVADGLAYLHQAKPMVIHRDLKLENILLAGRDVFTSNAKIADFGLSALVGTRGSAFDNIPREPLPRKGVKNRRASALLADDWTDAARARRASCLAPLVGGELSVCSDQEQLSGRTGTLMYMAPEVYRQERYTEKADVYSFGMIMYELVHRYQMISATDGSLEECQAYARRVARAHYRPPIDESVPRSLQDIIRACWNPTPQHRPSMAQVVELLEEALRSTDLAPLDRMPGGDAYPTSTQRAQQVAAQQQAHRTRRASIGATTASMLMQQLQQQVQVGPNGAYQVQPSAPSRARRASAQGQAYANGNGNANGGGAQQPKHRPAAVAPPPEGGCGCVVM